MGTSVLRATKNDVGGHARCFGCLWERLLRAVLCSSRGEVETKLVDGNEVVVETKLLLGEILS